MAFSEGAGVRWLGLAETVISSVLGEATASVIGSVFRRVAGTVIGVVG